MDKKPIHVLLVDDDKDDFVLTRDLLTEAEGARFEPEWADTYEAGLEAMEWAQHHVYLIDYHLGERDGLELLRAAIASGCTAPIIVLTGQGDHTVDVTGIAGAQVRIIVLKGSPVTAADFDPDLPYEFDDSLQWSETSASLDGTGRASVTIGLTDGAVGDLFNVSAEHVITSGTGQAHGPLSNDITLRIVG